MSFETLLIANRGDIALGIIEACRELNIRSVAVHSEADADMPYLRLADASVCIGPPPPAKSYLNIAAIISAAELTGADAIHPGYGFLAESPHFVEVCASHGIQFIGPPLPAMALACDKMKARDTVASAGVPVLPGAFLPDDPESLKRKADEIGYPLLIKAVYGGGGRGMRYVPSPSELEQAAQAATKEAKGAFGDGSLYLERAIPSPRHIEVQILADPDGRIIHLGERECSVQRRHQKLIEEAPAPFIDEDLREEVYEAAIAAAAAVGYRNAGTVEFIVDSESRFFFIEMNARIQVEHAVTEAVTGVNLLKEQIRIASGEGIGFSHAGINGHAIECRIYAEDPDRDFLPSTGRIKIVELPGGNGIRLDTAIYNGMEVSPFYDPLIAKLIAWGRDREEARIRMITALERFRIEGVKTTRDLNLTLITQPDFRSGEITTDFVERVLNGGRSGQGGVPSDAP